jgi:hypothetical protein
MSITISITTTTTTTTTAIIMTLKTAATNLINIHTESGCNHDE